MDKDNKWIFAEGEVYTKEEACYTFGCINERGGFNLTVARINSDVCCKEDAKANAELIVAAVNACKEINQDNPLVVAQNIKAMYKALKDIQDWLLFDSPIIEPNNWNKQFVKANDLASKVLSNIRSK